MLAVAQALLGVAVFIAIAYAVSADRKAVRWRPVFVGVGLQFALGLILLKLPFAVSVMAAAAGLVDALQAATRAGTAFVFGFIGGADAPYAVEQPAASFVLAFQALPLMLLVGALSALLFHWGMLPWLVRQVAKGLQRSMEVGGAAGVCAAANIFIGMVEAPLTIRPYLAKLTKAELFMAMTAGMATIAGTVMALYATVLSSVIPNAAGHLLTASLISAPAALALAFVMQPPAAGERKTETDDAPETRYQSSMDALTAGAMDGLKLVLNVAAMLIVFVALVALANQILSAGAPIFGQTSLQEIFGVIFAPLAWLCGVPWAEAAFAGGLLGEKVILNELIAYFSLAAAPADALSPRSEIIMLYALCGFANLGSLGVMIGGLAALAPERRAEIAALGLRSILSGLLATCMTGAVVGVLIAF